MTPVLLELIIQSLPTKMVVLSYKYIRIQKRFLITRETVVERDKQKKQ